MQREPGLPNVQSFELQTPRCSQRISALSPIDERRVVKMIHFLQGGWAAYQQARPPRSPFLHFLDVPSKMSAQTRTPIEVQRHLCRRFYEVVKFEEALIEACSRDPENFGRVPVDVATDIEGGAIQAFRSFVNRLAHVCDICRGGTTVSAVAVIQEFDGVHYFVGSNQRSQTQQAQLLAFVASLLQLPTKEMQSTQPRHTVLFRLNLFYVINFNQPRIRFYVKTLVRSLDYCITNLDQSSAGDPYMTMLKAVLCQLKELTRFHTDRGVGTDETAHLTACAELIRVIHLNHRNDHIAEAMFKQSRDGRINSSSQWQTLRHMIARLRAYYVSAETLVRSHERWPELFQNFQITIVPSSEPHSNPIKKTSTTAREMIGRMVSDETEIANRRADAERLQRFGLDAIIQEVCSSHSFTPLVHAEVLVHDTVRTYLADNPGVKYWSDWNYVGSSKPTCRLCTYYFSHISDVSVREPHGNLYSKWRLPDVFDYESAKKRNDILNKMAERVRMDALQTMKSKLPQGTNNDSSSFPTVAPWLKKGGAGALSTSDVSSMLGGMSLQSGIHIDPPVARAGSQRRAVASSLIGNEAELEADDDGGGVPLFTGRSCRNV
ncbi:Fc.00g080610.m01.CDS01 [Cosmosporella sp. VM-42]